MPLTISLPASAFEKLFQTGQPFLFGSLQVGETQALLANTLLGALPNAAVLFVQLRLMFPVIAFNDGNFLGGKGGYPANDVVMAAPSLEVGNQILDGNAACG